jgi:mannose-1-phosphate guanylyltransferase
MTITETAMILAAGRGTRLGSIGLTVPKVLLDLGGVPLLRRQLDYLEREGVRRVVVNSHHLGDQIAAFARSYDGPIELFEVRETSLLGTAGGVRHALEHLGDSAFLVLYGDVVVDEPLAGLRSAHVDNHALATIAVYETDEVYGKGTVIVNSRGRVLEFSEKVASPRAPRSALVNAGIYILEPAFIANLPAGRELDFGHDVFPNALGRRLPIFSHRLSRPVIDIGTPEGLERGRTSVTRDAGRSTPPSV